MCAVYGVVERGALPIRGFENIASRTYVVSHREVRYVLYVSIVRRVRPEKESLGASRDRAVGQRRHTLLSRRLFEYRRSHDVLYLWAGQAKSCLEVAALNFAFRYPPDKM